MKNESQNPAAQAGNTGSVAFLALFRLALLVGPETVVVKALSHSPVVCVLAAVVVLGVWLSVDVWPFRAETPVLAMAPVAPKVARAYPRNMTKAQWLNCILCQAFVYVALLHAKLTI